MYLNLRQINNGYIVELDGEVKDTPYSERTYYSGLDSAIDRMKTIVTSLE